VVAAEWKGVPVARVTIRYWAAAREASGTLEEAVDAVSLADAVADAVTRHGEKLSAVLFRCSYLVDDVPVGRRDHRAVVLSDGCVVEVLPPFAGG
jgi:molybdopterin converting factor small subunit